MNTQVTIQEEIESVKKSYEELGITGADVFLAILLTMNSQLRVELDHLKHEIDLLQLDTAIKPRILRI